VTYRHHGGNQYAATGCAHSSDATAEPLLVTVMFDSVVFLDRWRGGRVTVDRYILDALVGIYVRRGGERAEKID